MLTWIFAIFWLALGVLSTAKLERLRWFEFDPLTKFILWGLCCCAGPIGLLISDEDR